MSRNPGLLIIPDEEWQEHQDKRAGGQARGFGFGILPNGYHTEDRGNRAGVPPDHVVLVESWAEEAYNNSERALQLVVHEYGHCADYPLQDHGHGHRRGLLHAVRVWFDVRAYGWPLRLRRGDRKRWNQAVEWFQARYEEVVLGAEG